MSKRVSDKIAHLVREGKKPKQAVAIAHSMKDKKPAKSSSKKY